MPLDRLSETLTLALSGIALPLIAWFGRGLYDSWRRNDVYISTIPGTGQAPGLLFGPPGEAVAVSWGIRVRVLNISDRLLALEKIRVHFRWSSPLLPKLSDLVDDAAEVVLLKDPYDHLADYPIPAQLPVVLKPKGGTVYLEIRAAMRLRGKGRFFSKSILTYSIPSRSFRSPEEELEHKKAEEQFTRSLEPGGEWVHARISGKVRAYPIEL